LSDISKREGNNTFFILLLSVECSCWQQ